MPALFKTDLRLAKNDVFVEHNFSSHSLILSYTESQ